MMIATAATPATIHIQLVVGRRRADRFLRLDLAAVLCDFGFGCGEVLCGLDFDVDLVFFFAALMIDIPSPMFYNGCLVGERGFQKSGYARFLETPCSNHYTDYRRKLKG